MTQHVTDWHTASYSANGSHCVEAREKADGAEVRDSMHRHEGHLEFPTAEWATLLGGIRRAHC